MPQVDRREVNTGRQPYHQQKQKSNQPDRHSGLVLRHKIEYTHLPVKGIKAAIGGRLRCLLHMSILNAVRVNEPTSKALYERVYERSGSRMKAYVPVQKRLLLMAYVLWSHGVDHAPVSI